MDQATFQLIESFTQNVGIVGFLLLAWILEKRRADRLEIMLINALQIQAAKTE